MKQTSEPSHSPVLDGANLIMMTMGADRQSVAGIFFSFFLLAWSAIDRCLSFFFHFYDVPKGLDTICRLLG